MQCCLRWWKRCLWGFRAGWLVRLRAVLAHSPASFRIFVGAVLSLCPFWRSMDPVVRSLVPDAPRVMRCRGLSSANLLSVSMSLTVSTTACDAHRNPTSSNFFSFKCESRQEQNVYTETPLLWQNSGFLLHFGILNPPESAALADILPSVFSVLHSPSVAAVVPY